MPKVKALEEYDAEQHGEWFTYVAKVPIDIGNARAFNVGDAVPVHHVSNGIVQREDVMHVDETEAQQVATVVRPEPPRGTLDQPPVQDAPKVGDK